MKASQAQRWLAAIVESSDDAIVGKRLDGTIVSWNNAAHRMFGYTAEEIIGASVLTLFPPELRHEEAGIVERLARGERVHHFETIRVAKDGHRIDVSLSVSPILDDTGGVAGAAKIARDITEAKRMREHLAQMSEQLQDQATELEQQLEETTTMAVELENANQELAQALSMARAARELAERAKSDAEWAKGEAERANRAKSEFLAMMSHELRTPLNAISGYADLMDAGVAGELQPTYRQYVDRIRKSQRHLLDLIADVLDLSKLEAGRLHIDVKPVAVAHLFDRLEEMVLPQAVSRQQRLELYRPDEPLHVLASEDRALQILLNLVSNAIKFTPELGRITVGVEPEKESIAMIVCDNGVGVQTDDVTRIFQPFVQADHSLTRRQEGAGLGLSISRELARAMGGDVALEDTSARGSTFVLRLPWA